jgi:flagellar protein FliO/FliZ
MGDPIAPAAPGFPLFESMAAAALVLVLLMATLWLLRRGLTGRRSAGALMAVEGSLALGDRRSLVVIGVEGRRLVIGVAPGSVQLVTELASRPGFSRTDEARR